MTTNACLQCGSTDMGRPCAKNDDGHHALPPLVVVRLSGADVLDVEVLDHEAIQVEVRQYHADYKGDDFAETSEDEHGRYEVVA